MNNITKFLGVAVDAFTVVNQVVWEVIEGFEVDQGESARPRVEEADRGEFNEKALECRAVQAFDFQDFLSIGGNDVFLKIIKEYNLNCYNILEMSMICKLWRQFILMKSSGLVFTRLIENLEGSEKSNFIKHYDVMPIYQLKPIELVNINIESSIVEVKIEDGKDLSDMTSFLKNPENTQYLKCIRAIDITYQISFQDFIDVPDFFDVLDKLDDKLISLSSFSFFGIDERIKIPALSRVKSLNLGRLYESIQVNNRPFLRHLSANFSCTSSRLKLSNCPELLKLDIKKIAGKRIDLVNLPLLEIIFVHEYKHFCDKVNNNWGQKFSEIKEIHIRPDLPISELTDVGITYDRFLPTAK